MPCPNNKQCPTMSLPYIVREGDSVFSIARTFSTSEEKIYKANVNLNPYNLNIGQTLCIPLPKEDYPSCSTTNYYIAQEGDTFFSIGRKFGVDVDEIIDTNQGVLPENIYEGIILCLPISPSPVCLSVNKEGTQITLTERKSGNTKVYKSKLSASSVLVPGQIILTKKRLESGDVNGAKELLFSPFEFGIRGKSKMRDSSSLFLEVENSDMLSLFNSCPVGTILEVEV